MRAVLACLPCERPDHRTAALARRATGGASPSPEPGADAGPRRRRRRLDPNMAQFGSAEDKRSGAGRRAQGASGPGFGHGPGSRVAVLYRVPS